MQARFIPCALVLSALSGSAASAQLIVGVDQSGTASIYNVNVNTGVATPIYTGAGTDAKAWGMAYDGATNTLYWNNGVALFSSPFGAVLTPTSLGNITLAGSNTSVVSLAFTGGKLYATRNIATEAVYEINLATRELTQVYAYASTFDFGGLDVDASTGEMYGLTDTPTATRGLYKFDLAGQSESFIAPYPAGETDIDALAVDSGRAYYVTDGPLGTQPNFYVFDVSTGTQIGTLPSPFTGSGTFSAATFVPVPEPTTIGLIALALGAVATRRR